MVDVTPSRRPAPPSPAPPRALDLPVLSALNVLLQYHALTEAWSDAVASLVAIDGSDVKDEISFRKTLNAPHSIGVLQLLWKDSSFVGEAELEALGLERLFAGCAPSCHGLALILSPGSATFAATEKRLQKLVRAARCFGLIEVIPVQAKRYELHPTASLHQLMLIVTRASTLTLFCDPNMDGDQA